MIVHSHGRRQANEYELVYDGKNDDQPHLMGLLDPTKLDNNAEWSEQSSEWSASGRGAVGMWSACGRMDESDAAQGLQADLNEIVKKPRIQGNGKLPSSLVAAVVQ